MQQQIEEDMPNLQRAITTTRPTGHFIDSNMYFDFEAGYKKDDKMYIFHGIPGKYTSQHNGTLDRVYGFIYAVGTVKTIVGPEKYWELNLGGKMRLLNNEQGRYRFDNYF